jgi:hypothetical protein
MIDWKLTLLGDTVHDGTGLPVDETEVVRFSGRVEGNSAPVSASSGRGGGSRSVPKLSIHSSTDAFTNGLVEAALPSNKKDAQALDAFKSALGQRPGQGQKSPHSGGDSSRVAGKAQSAETMRTDIATARDKVSASAARAAASKDATLPSLTSFVTTARPPSPWKAAGTQGRLRTGATIAGTPSEHRQQGHGGQGHGGQGGQEQGQGWGAEPKLEAADDAWWQPDRSLAHRNFGKATTSGESDPIAYNTTHVHF